MKDEQTTTKVSENRQKKEVLVAEYTEKVEKAKGIVFANYQGLTHLQLEAIKKAMKKMDAEFVAAKNTLLLRALDGKVDVSAEKDKFTQPTAALFIYNDIIEPIKSLAKTIKELTLPVVKFGILEGKIISDKDVAKLATIAPLPILRAQLLGQMKAPISGLHRALNWNLQKLVMTLSAIEKKKQVSA
ncbi:MAG TPA: 50S ribosomal protein L10 [Patescibacteria group bacterium]|nr:50S ribosomal protein L10 [Patescibacteria group bacterium]